MNQDAIQFKHIHSQLGMISGDWSANAFSDDLIVSGKDHNHTPVQIATVESPNPADAQFIAEAPNNIRFLLRLIDRAKIKVRELDAQVKTLSAPRTNHATQIAMHLGNPHFIEWLQSVHGLEGKAKANAEKLIKKMLNIKSKTDLVADLQAAARWQAFEQEFRNWDKGQ